MRENLALNNNENDKTLGTALREYAEWLLVWPENEGRRSETLRATEIEVEEKAGRLIVSFPGIGGFHVLRVVTAERIGETIELSIASRNGKKGEKLTLIARVSAAALRTELEAARIARCIKLAQKVSEHFNGAKIIEAHVSKGRAPSELGKNAQIVVQSVGASPWAVLANIADKKIDAENLLISALLWFHRLGQIKKTASVQRLLIAADGKSIKRLKKSATLLRQTWRKTVGFLELDPELEILVETSLSAGSPLREKPKKLGFAGGGEIPESAAKIIALAPEDIDAIHARHGLTLRYKGLAMARFRTVMGKEKAWFGAESKRRVLDNATWDDFLEFFEKLREYRSANAENKTHYFYRAAPEGWLESLLRRDISRLEPNLILSPLYAQFRLSSDGRKARPVDLLALRTDGRLVVIELKVSPAREHVFQGLEYWRRVELHRRAGNIKTARLFDDHHIADLPPLVYLVAPMLSFHPDTEFLASTIDPKIEIYRFDLNEDWRAGVRVANRRRLD
jgi:hypothetical protein